MQKLLLIEPSKFVRKIATMHLNAHGNQVTTAVYAEEIMDTFIQIGPEVVVIDINLTDTDGVRIIEQMKKRDSKVRIYIISENITSEQSLRLGQLGVSEYLIKPFSLEELIEKVAV